MKSNLVYVPVNWALKVVQAFSIVVPGACPPVKVWENVTDNCRVGVTVGVTVLVGVCVAVVVLVGVYVGVTVEVTVGVIVFVGVCVGVTDAVIDGVTVFVGVGVKVVDGVGVGAINTHEFQYPLFVNHVDALLPVENVCGVPNLFETNCDKSINSFSTKVFVL